MIDRDNENLIRVADVAKHLPKGHDGCPVHYATVCRWTTRGCRGVVLESFTIGGYKYTSLEAVRRFSDRLTGEPVSAPAPKPAEPTAAARRADGALTALGI
jgi:hypothetical protein